MHSPWVSTFSTWTLNQNCIRYVEGASSLIMVREGFMKWFFRMSNRTWASS